MNERLQFPPSIHLELANFFLGDQIGRGATRTVYQHKFNSNWVVKFDIGTSRQFDNQYEWMIWNHFKNTRWAKYLAPCIDISEAGSILIMERTEPVSKLEGKLPDFLGDLHVKNFGTIDGKLVCHDYGNVNLIHMAEKVIRLRRIVTGKDKNFPNHMTLC